MDPAPVPPPPPPPDWLNSPSPVDACVTCSFFCVEFPPDILGIEAGWVVLELNDFFVLPLAVTVGRLFALLNMGRW